MLQGERNSMNTAPTIEQEYLLKYGMPDKCLGVPKSPKGCVVVDGDSAYVSDVMRAWASHQNAKEENLNVKPQIKFPLCPIYEKNYTCGWGLSPNICGDKPCKSVPITQ